MKKRNNAFSCQMSFFDPVYQINDPSLNGNESSENETPNRSMQRQISTDTNPNRSDETLEGRRSTNDADDSAAEVGQTSNRTDIEILSNFFRFPSQELLNESNRFKVPLNKRR